MQNNKNLILAVVLIVGFMFMWDTLVVSRYAPPPSAKPASPQNAPVPDAALSPSQQSNVTVANPSALPVNTGPEQFFTLETDQVRVRFGTQGGRVVSWAVKENGQMVDLVTPDPAVSPWETFRDVNFSAQKQSDRQITFSADHPNGFRLMKTVTLGTDNPYLASTDLELLNLSNQTLQIKFNLGWASGLDKRVEEPAPTAEMRGLGYSQDRVKTWRPGFIFDRSLDKSIEGPFEWVGVDNHHFLAALVAPAGGSFPQIQMVANKHQPATVQVPLVYTLAPQASAQESFTFYVGPKEGDRLKSVGVRLEEAIDYGFFGVIAKGLMAALSFLKDLTGNYGWAIVVMTLVYQLAVYPLTKTSLQHSNKMREVQPKLKKLQEQHRKDPKRLQIETLNLYKKHGMKFMGMEGCVPMLIQIPFFFAVYSALQSSYELRGAPWVLWIQDLSAPDPFYVLPVLMGLASLLQQKMTSMAMDPAQAKMMLIMPVFLVFVFLKMPSGLVLYWCVQSLATVGVQQFLKWKHPTPQLKPS